MTAHPIEDETPREHLRNALGMLAGYSIMSESERQKMIADVERRVRAALGKIEQVTP